MRLFSHAACAVAATAIILGKALAAPVITVHPGNANDIVITKDDTVNATSPAPPQSNIHDQVKALEKLPISLVNNFPGGAINAYVTGLDEDNRLVMLQPNGAFYYPTANSKEQTPQVITENLAIPLGPHGSTTNITLPGYISAARIWLAEGELNFFTVYSSQSNGPSLVEPSSVNPSDPSSNVNWGFVELTNSEKGGLFANISYVDFVGLILGMTLESSDSPTQTAVGLSANAVPAICASLQAQAAKDGYPWGDLCMAGSSGVLRIIAPSDYTSLNPTAFSSYWDGYIEDVWTMFATKDLVINTQSSAGQVNCSVQHNGLLTCAGDNRGYARPVAADIFGCNSGPFAIWSTDNNVHRAVVPRLCAAVTRSTLLIEGGHLQPGLSSADYYTSTPTNWYSKFVHENEVDGKGYAFSYDDVNPDDDVNQSGVVASPNPELLTIIVGGPMAA